MKLYVAGPMSGIPQFNYPAFIAAADKLRAAGHEVINPAEMDDPETKAEAMASEDGVLVGGTCNGETWGDFLARDVKIVADDVDGVVVLDNWFTSRGARLEAFIAVNCQKPVFNIDLQELNPYVITAAISEHALNQGDIKHYG